MEVALYLRKLAGFQRASRPVSGWEDRTGLFGNGGTCLLLHGGTHYKAGGRLGGKGGHGGTGEEVGNWGGQGSKGM